MLHPFVRADKINFSKQAYGGRDGDSVIVITESPLPKHLPHGAFRELDRLRESSLYAKFLNYRSIDSAPPRFAQASLGMTTRL
jgi:hypothetical protein